MNPTQQPMPPQMPKPQMGQPPMPMPPMGQTPPMPPVPAVQPMPQAPTPPALPQSGGIDELKAAMPGNLASGVVSDVPASAPAKPESGSANSHKKQLLQRLMTNLLNKPGRSMHEMINGVKDAMGAYKNYAKEWDNLSGASALPVAVDTALDPVNWAQKGSSTGIQKILQGIQAKKGGAAPAADGGGGPGFSSMPQAPNMVAPQAVQASNAPAPIQPMPDLIAGQPQTSSFNRPAPVNNLGIFGY